MQVNIVQQSPNFGMSLRIKKTPKSIAALKEQPIEYINRLENVGQSLIDTHYYHVELGEDLTPRLISSELAHFAPGTKADSDIKLNTEVPESLKVGSAYVFRKCGGLASPGTTNAQYNVQKFGRPLNSKNDIEDIAEVALKLDNNAKDYVTAQALEEARIAAEKEKVSQAVDNLVNNFSVEA